MKISEVPESMMCSHRHTVGDVTIWTWYVITSENPLQVTRISSYVVDEESGELREGYYACGEYVEDGPHLRDCEVPGVG